VFSVSRRPRPGARYLFDTFDMTSSMAVEIQLDGIDTHGGRYGNFSSDLAPTTKAPRRSRGSKVGRYQADYRKFERLPWLAKIRVGGPRRLPPPRPRKRSDRQRRTKRQRRAPSPDGAADRCGTLERRPPPRWGPVTGGSDRADVEGFRALAAGADLELDGLTLVEAAVAIARDVGVVDEHVLASLDGDESEPLLAIEKLYGASRHEFTFVA